jgi:hypothetical protein
LRGVHPTHSTIGQASGDSKLDPDLSRRTWTAALIFLAAPLAVAAQDTTTVRADGPPVWGEDLQLVEELRIGSSTSGASDAFTRIVDVVVDSAGVIWVADGVTWKIHRFTAAGRFLGVLGGEGRGPGRFETISAMEAMPDGRVVVWDPHAERLTFFAPNGSFAEMIRRDAGAVEGPGEVLRVDSAGFLHHLSLQPSTADSPGPPRAVWYRLSDEGTVLDSLVAPSAPRGTPGGRTYPFGHMSPFTPGTLSAMSPLGYLVVARAADYTLLRTLSDGSTLRILRAWTPVRLQMREHLQYTALARHVADLWKADYDLDTDVPTTKPPLWAMRIDDEGRIWVARHRPGVYVEESPTERRHRRESEHYRGATTPPLEWWEPLVTDVIDADGRFLGTLTFPSNRATIVAARGLRVWTVEPGPGGEPNVVRYRVRPDRPSPPPYS